MLSTDNVGLRKRGFYEGCGGQAGGSIPGKLQDVGNILDVVAVELFNVVDAFKEESSGV